mmetsp:Transcript_6681/g.9756  ORF Transcript_6681/g.9756 Transcript_6681/m.9756 type:complete len:237 (-) Transcript_6681:133-843(-)|eukprot:CAMPEP_0196815692 /NCGR_PEP_ID=MMETSP1362-20130617/51279_1 /TAXON_ID=163516 /ORGANISM="Leptocylindrus danicus, Strain CCMP1856" /LENGTH=236 /DNA_ID=CAMNT_0042192741 /DNA_START=22 /DNA_END=732 /DNA_ORIENTATION=-
MMVFLHNVATVVALLNFSVVLAQNEYHEDDPRCLGWAEAGECDANPNYMWEYCRYECELIEKEIESDLFGINDFFDLKALNIDQEEISFKQFRGKFTVVTNVASYCGYTKSHYQQLVELYGKLKSTNKVEIMAFPCNQFGAQEPETCDKIKLFAESRGVEFMMMDKVDVNGKDTSPVFKLLKKSTKTRSIKWNFNTYFVVDPHGSVTAYHGINPSDLFIPLVEAINNEHAYEGDEM